MMKLGFAVIFFGVILAACQPLSGRPVPAPTEVIPPTSHPGPTPTLPISTDISLPSFYATIKIAYISQEQLWVWENGKADPLTRANPDTTLAFSGNGDQIAFIRDGQLLLIGSDGKNEHVLISSEQMASIAPQNPTRLVNFSWVPGKPLLILSTLEDSSAGLQPNQGLYLLDVDTGEIILVFPAGQGGLMYPSPDGGWLAVVSQEQTLLMKTDGSDGRTLLTYPPYQSGHFPYIPKPYWAANSHSFLLEVRSEESTIIWHITVAGETSIIFSSAYRGLSFSPDLSKYAYVLDDGMLDSSIEMHIADSNGMNDSIYAQASHEDYAGLGFLGWGPDSQSFLFTDTNRDIRWMKIGEMEAQAVPIPSMEPFRAMKILWLDAGYFVVIIRSPSGIWLSALGQESLQVVDFPEGDFIAADLARGFDALAINGLVP